MVEYEYFPAIVTKGIEIEKREDERRIFKGHITAEIIDRQQEFIFVKEVMAIMDTFMKVNPVMSEIHTNRMVGKVLDYEKSEINGVASVLITGEIYKVDGVTLYDKVWNKIVKGEYRGLSMGGASKEREPIIKDGRQALELRKLELYEIAICPTPANPFAIIEKVNTFAKANDIGQERIQDLDGRCILKCDQIGMCFEKGTNKDDDVDLDNEQHGLEQFDKPTEKDHIPSTPEEIEEEARKKNKVEKKGKETLTQESATTRADNIGQATFSPKETKDVISQIKAPKTTHISPPKIPEAPVAKQTVPEDPKPEEKETKKMSVHDFIEHFGEDIVRKALEERDVIKYLKGLSKKYQ